MISRFKLGSLVNGGVSQLGGGSLFTTGKVYYVSSTKGSNGNIGTDPDFPLATIAAAQSAATASVGDMVVVLPGHSETLTAALTLSKAGVTYTGLGNGLLRPTITGNGTIDAIDITGANITVENFQFPAPGTDDQTADINVSGAGVTIRNTYHIGSQTSKNKTDIITVASGANDLLIEGMQAYNVTVDCVSAISLEAAVARPVIQNCLIQGTFSTAAVMDEATATLVTVRNSIIKNSKAATAVLSFANNSTGVCSFLHVSGRHTTIASNIAAGTGMDFFEVRVTEEAALNGAIMPAADAD
jgi:hypothetical protein